MAIFTTFKALVDENSDFPVSHVINYPRFFLMLRMSIKLFL